ncbi:eukaryotic membrane protein family-domain-containing protein [Camillea tinctor]|nr:eukaryotic membrane protein family-domain-containing protein [Camillea tinctor]
MREREKDEHQEEHAVKKTKQSFTTTQTPPQTSPQPQPLPSPPTQTPTPPPTDTDPFPTLEITTATPITSQFKYNQSDSYLRTNTNRHSASSDDTSTSSNDSHSSSSAISDPPEPPVNGNAKKPADATVSKPRTQSAVRKLSASQMQALTSSPDSLPVAVFPVPMQRKPSGAEYPMSAGAVEAASRPSLAEQLQAGIHSAAAENDGPVQPEDTREAIQEPPRTAADFRRPPSSRTLSSPPINRRPSSGPPLSTPSTSRRNSFNPLARPVPLNITIPNGPPVTRKPSMSTKQERQERQERPDPIPSPRMPAIPLPPMSLPTHLQLELAGQRPSPLYIYSAHSADAPYESSAVKFERLLNALLLPPYLEQILFFGALACLDAWLYTFTILPMRFIIALGELGRWWAYVLGKEVRWVVGYVWQGTWRLWQRGRGRTMSRARVDSNLKPSEAEPGQGHSRDNSLGNAHNGIARHRTVSEANAATSSAHTEHSRPNGNGVFHPSKHPMPRPAHLRHRRTKSVPSNLTSYHKADLLQGAILICSVMAMMNLDASRMYHFIRAQSSMKLYVIYNILEVGDRLLSAIGQDILECLFSSETLSRNSSGRSKVLLPFGMFILSLIYNVIHTWCLFYQVITLNVAVNSYSNSLLTLLISNQFVEIKGSVFKRIEKENLFQLTCSDVVERFQLWIILLIIGMRNVVEVGGLSVPGAGGEVDGGATKAGPLHTSSILPASFTVIPSWLLSGEVLSPFLVVIGIEMLVDWIKHAYINKFNNVKPAIYSRMLDVLCKDYYTNAFATPSLTRRLGLPLLPLSCLFIRASIQVYHMFLATHLHPPIPTSTTELSVESSTPSSPAMIAALDHLDTLIRNALGRAVYGYPYESPHVKPFWTFSSDDAIALLTMVVFFFLAWVVLLIVKLLLGMLLLRYSRKRYAVMKLKEHAVAAGKAERENFSQPGQRIGPWGAVELGDERRKWIYDDDPEGLKRMRDRERKTQERFKDKGDDNFAKVTRYEMVAKRIW